jgi:hypothetical protein
VCTSTNVHKLMNGGGGFFEIHDLYYLVKLYGPIGPYMNIVSCLDWCIVHIYC